MFCLPSAERGTQLFELIFTQPGAHLLEHPIQHAVGILGNPSPSPNAGIICGCSLTHSYHPSDTNCTSFLAFQLCPFPLSLLLCLHRQCRLDSPSGNLLIHIPLARSGAAGGSDWEWGRKDTRLSLDSLQGDPHGCGKVFVDIKFIVGFQYRPSSSLMFWLCSFWFCRAKSADFC